MANGHEKEKRILDGLETYFEIQTNIVWDEEHKIDAVVIRPLDLSPFFPTPIPLQITGRTGNWDKRAATLQAVSVCAGRLAFVEISTANISLYLIIGLATALKGLFFDAKAPTFALIEVGANGRYVISDLAARIKFFQQSLTHRMPGDLKGRIIYWKDGSGFIEVGAVNPDGQREVVTFYAPSTNLVNPEFVTSLTQFSGSIDPHLQPRVLLNDGGMNRRNDFRKFALNIRLTPTTADDEPEF